MSQSIVRRLKINRFKCVRKRNRLNYESIVDTEYMVKGTFSSLIPVMTFVHDLFITPSIFQDGLVCGLLIYVAMTAGFFPLRMYFLIKKWK